jgi:hypothetical protein
VPAYKSTNRESSYKGRRAQLFAQETLTPPYQGACFSEIIPLTQKGDGGESCQDKILSRLAEVRVLEKIKAWFIRQYGVIEGNLKSTLVLAVPAMLIGVVSVWHKLHGLELVGTISAFASGWVIAGWIVYANRKAYKLTATHSVIEPILYHDEHNYFTHTIDPPRSQLAILLEIINAPTKKRRSKSPGHIRAKITFTFGGRAQIISPGAWVSEFFSSVEIGPGDTKELIIALSRHCVELTRFWSAVINRRANSTEAMSISYPLEIPPYQEGLVSVDLISCESGGIVASFELGIGLSPHTCTQEIKYLKQLS